MPSRLLSLVLALAILTACTAQENQPALPGPVEAMPTELFFPPSTLLPSLIPSLSPSLAPTLTPSPAPTFTPIPDPELPCGSAHPDGTYAFIDCNDIRRIRQEIVTGRAETISAWGQLLRDVEHFRRLLRDPATFSVYDWLDGGGGGRYSPRNLALAYLITGEAAYAVDLRNLMRTVVNRTPTRDPNAGPETGWVISPISGGVIMQSVLLAYLVVRDTFDPGPQRIYDEYFYVQMALWEEIAGPEGWIQPWTPGNVGISVDAVAATVALALPDHPGSDQLYADATRRLGLRLNLWYDTDGGWGAYADSYAPTLLESVLLFAETLYKTRGEDLYAVDFAGKSLHSLCEWFLLVMAPDGVLPAINDGVWGALQAGNLLLCARRSGDPALVFAYERFSWGRQHAFEGVFMDYSIPFGSVAWADSSLLAAEPTWTSRLANGLAVLRSGWAVQDQYLLLQFTDTSHHNHHSYGNIVLYDDGPWLLDNGYELDGGTFGGSQYERSISTLEHSTLTLDGSNQTFTGATASTYTTLQNTAIVSVISNTYPSFRHRRTVLWAEPWHQWLVIDDASMSAGGWHTLQLRWFVRASPMSHTDDGQWAFGRGNDELTLNMFSDEPANTSSISRHYSVFPMAGNAQGVELAFVSTAWPTRLVTVLTSRLDGMPAVEAVNRTDSPDGTLLTIQREGLLWNWLLPHSFPGQAQIGDLRLNGQAGYFVNDQEAIAAYGLFGGTQLSTGEASLVTASAPLSLESDPREAWVIIEAANPATISLYWPTGVGRIEDEAGITVEFTLEASQNLTSCSWTAYF